MRGRRRKKKEIVINKLVQSEFHISMKMKMKKEKEERKKSKLFSPPKNVDDNKVTSDTNHNDSNVDPGQEDRHAIRCRRKS